MKINCRVSSDGKDNTHMVSKGRQVEQATKRTLKYPYKDLSIHDDVSEFLFQPLSVVVKYQSADALSQKLYLIPTLWQQVTNKFVVAMTCIHVQMFYFV